MISLDYDRLTMHLHREPLLDEELILRVRLNHSISEAYSGRPETPV